MMLHPTQELEPPANPARFSDMTCLYLESMCWQLDLICRQLISI